MEGAKHRIYLVAYILLPGLKIKITLQNGNMNFTHLVSYVMSFTEGNI